MVPFTSFVPLRCRQCALIKQLAREVGSNSTAELPDVSSLQLKEEIKTMLERGGPLLLVLDDLWTEHQLAELLGPETQLPPGSQLLLTARQRDAVAAHNAMPMELLPNGLAMTLLSWHACRQASLPAQLAQGATLVQRPAARYQSARGRSPPLSCHGE